MNYKLEGRDILYNDEQLGPYPDHLLKRVDEPTNTLPGGKPRRKWQYETAKATHRAPTEVGRTEPLYNGVMWVRKALDSVAQNPNPIADKQAPIPDDPRVRSRHLKCVGYYLGADQVAICRIPEYAMFRDAPPKAPEKGPIRLDGPGTPIDCDYKYAIVLVKRKDSKTTLASSGCDWIFNCCSHTVYGQLTFWSDAMAYYLRRLGFDALESNNRNYRTVMTSLCIAAGIGECGRNGICVSPFFGANFKSAAILTNMELEPDKPIDFGLREFCNNCGICAEKCTSGAISRDNEIEEYNGYGKFKMDYVRCATLGANLATASGCGKCTTLCPWNRPDSMPGDFKDWDGDVKFLHDSAKARADYLRECNFETEDYKTRRWWFDLVENEVGDLVIPKNSKYTEL